jgi:hypothetical protein
VEDDFTSNVLPYKGWIIKKDMTMFAFVGFVVVCGAACVGCAVMYTKIQHFREDAQRYYDHVVNQDS